MTDRPAAFRAMSWTGRWMPTSFILTTCLVAMPTAFAKDRVDQAGDELVPQQRLGGIKLEEADTNPPDVNQPFVVPANDMCAGALTIPAAGPFPHLTATVDLFDGTLTGDPVPTCSFQGAPCTTAPTCHSRGIWWTFTPTVSSNYRFSTCGVNAPGTTRTDTVLSIYTSGGGCAGPFTEVACNDDADAACGTSALQSIITASLNAGTTYYVLAFSWNSTAPPVGQSSVQIQVQNLVVTPPANDACAGALTLALGGRLGTNAGAANDYSLSGAACFGGVGQAASTAVGRDSVYSFTAPGAGSYSFRAQTYDAANSGNIVLYSSPTCPSPGSISCTAPVRASNRQAGATNFVAAEEIFCQPMAAGEQTFLFVDEAALVAAGGNYLIEATRCGLEVESNNTPGTANALLACPMEGTINASDADFYGLGSPASGTRVFTITDGIQANDADFDMRVTNTTDTLEYDDEDNNPIHGNFGPNIQGRALTGAASFIRVNHFTAGVNSEPYRLYTVLQPPGGDPFGSSSSPELNNAGNNTLGGAESAANYYYNGFLNATNDLDAFKFCAVEGDQVSIGIDADPARNLTPVNPAIFLFNEVGTQLFGFSDAAVTSNNTSGAGNLVATTPFSPGESMVWRARYTGSTTPASTRRRRPTSRPPATTWSPSASTARAGSTFTATLDTEITAEFPTVNGGDIFEYTISLSNRGAKTALEAEFVDVLPAGVTFVSLEGTGTDSAVCTQLPAPGSGEPCAAGWTACVRAATSTSSSRSRPRSARGTPRSTTP